MYNRRLEGLYVTVSNAVKRMLVALVGHYSLCYNCNSVAR